jgi:CRISPR-associated protein Csb2
VSEYLCVSVTFLDPWFHGRGDSGPEWPPSPLRLFQALVAGSHMGRRGSDWTSNKERAFRWLETQDPPDVVAPTAHTASSYVSFVPNNDSDLVFERQERLTAKAVRPVHMTDPAVVHYVWPLASEDTPQEWASIICDEAGHIHALGWGIDQVVSAGRMLTAPEIGSLSGIRWRPWPAYRAGSPTYRVPVAGCLADLEAAHRSQLDRLGDGVYQTPLRSRCFRSVTYMPESVLPPRSFAAFEFPYGCAFASREVAKVAAMLRSLTCRPQNRDDFGHHFPELHSEVFLAGHVGAGRGRPDGRFSYVPLPSVGHRNADGLVRRVLIVEPYGPTSGPADWAQRRLRGATLVDTEGTRRVALLELSRPQSRRMVGAYVDPAAEWITVTPVVLPGYDDGKHTKANQLFLKALGQAGIPRGAVTDFTLRKAASWPGSHHPHEYFVPDYLRGYSRWHAALRFQEAVPGPVTIGAGRHVGLGLFAAVLDCGNDG